jgi:hypothetical protein
MRVQASGCDVKYIIGGVLYVISAGFGLRTSLIFWRIDNVNQVLAKDQHIPLWGFGCEPISRPAAYLTVLNEALACVVRFT